MIHFHFISHRCNDLLNQFHFPSHLIIFSSSHLRFILLVITMLKLLLLSLVGVSLLSPPTQGLSCFCGASPCESPACCKSGVYTLDACGCCQVCAKAHGEVSLFILSCLKPRRTSSLGVPDAPAAPVKGPAAQLEGPAAQIKGPQGWGDIT